LKELFHAYEDLAARADGAFQRMEREYGDRINCRLHCADCCHAIFGLFLIESAYLKYHFEQLAEDERRAALKRADKADRDLAALERSLAVNQDDPHVQAYALAREKIRCPLLNERDECILYPVRPITCRVYGIPAVINGRAFVCGQAGFQQGESYPAFDLDAVYRDLYQLSKELLKSARQADMDRASLLVSVSKSIRSPLEDLIKFPACLPGLPPPPGRRSS